MIDVLLAEDDKSHAFLIRRAFDSSGVRREITHVQRLQQMLDVLAEKRPDVLILDYLRPDSRRLDAVRGHLEVANRLTVLDHQSRRRVHHR